MTMDRQKLQSLIGLSIEHDGTHWVITSIDPQEALVSSEDEGGRHQTRTINTAVCLSAIVVDEIVELEEVKPFIVKDD